jgi:ADP-ribose pyrophosphatase
MSEKSKSFIDFLRFSKFTNFYFKGKKFVKIKHPGAVGILPIYKDSFVLLKEFRPVIKRNILSIPTGKIKTNENPELTAKRELLEEAGLKAKKVHYLFSFFNSPGISDEITHVYYAEKFEKLKSKREKKEFIKKIVKVPVEKFEKFFVKENENRKIVFDGKTMLAILYYLKFKSSLVLKSFK